MANHGKRAPLARMSRGDGILIYSPTTTYPHGAPLRAVTFVGEVTGEQSCCVRLTLPSETALVWSVVYLEPK